MTAYLQILQAEGNTETDAIGINALMLRYLLMRKETHQEFLKQWDELEQTDFGERLLETIKGKS